MILVWGLPNDPATRAVCDCLRRLSAPVFFLNHAEIYETHVIMGSGSRLSFTVTCGRNSCRLEDVRAAYLRPYDFRDYPRPEGAASSDPAMVHHLIGAWAEHTPALVISRPSAEGTNQSKLYQAIAIRNAGFLTPETLVTGDCGAIREFQVRHGKVIYKSMSSVRSVVKELRIEDLEGAAQGATQFQQKIEGTNVRVHVVGSECFACGIETDGADYRYANSRMFAVSVPTDVAGRAVALARSLGMHLAGLDLIVTADGRWYCLEVNPNPAFACFADADCIAAAMARLLIQAHDRQLSRPAG